jgi:hypothetical protein
MGPGSRGACHRARIRATRWLVRDDSEYSHGAISPELCIFIVPPRSEGAGKAGRRLRPQHRVQWVDKNAHGFDRYSRDIPAFPAQWCYGLYVLSPVSGVCCHRRCAGLTTRLDTTVAAPGPHDFAVRCRVFVRCKHLTPQRPSHPAPTYRDDRETSLGGRGRRELYACCDFGKTEYLRPRGLTRFQ